MIRKATIKDIPKIGAMAGIVFRETYKDILSAGQMEYMMDMMYSPESLLRQMTAEGNVFFLEEGKGYVSYRPDGVTRDGRERFHLEKLYVMPAYQKTGLGRVLFELVVSEVRAAAGGRPARLELNVNRGNPALTFYRHIGMYTARQGDFPIGNNYYMNDFIMALDL